MTDWRGQVLSGIRLALNTVTAILVLYALIGGLVFVERNTTGDLLKGFVLLGISVALLLVTAGRWAKWFFAACCVVVLRAVIMMGLGRTISVPSLPAPRLYFAEVAAASALMAFLSYRFVNIKPNRLDSVCLVGALAALASLLVSSQGKNASPTIALVSGLAALFFLTISWVYSKRGGNHELHEGSP